MAGGGGEDARSIDTASALVTAPDGTANTGGAVGSVSEPDNRARRGEARRRRVAVAGWVLAGLIVLGLVLTAVGWRVSGGRWLDIATPSMGRAAPVMPARP